jgi:hypothetical protein
MDPNFRQELDGFGSLSPIERFKHRPRLFLVRVGDARMAFFVGESIPIARRMLAVLHFQGLQLANPGQSVFDIWQINVEADKKYMRMDSATDIPNSPLRVKKIPSWPL